MANDNQKWLVSESNPRPDNYVAIFCVTKASKIKRLGCSVYPNVNEALKRAKYLQVKHKTKNIRIFYPNSVSIIIKKGREINNEKLEVTSN
ncbi:hypothetical protein QYS48_08095 [Marivirga arenosa]|uniref:Uncharacterized protein n=1 Tax=Marivirga arenosa TaxID=3059076 RepID=A0AA49JI74_9BACT|nr:hypothetical protein [Marivirga sp. ABR2-2]WKK86831.1 hypothetical protein QYS48_08095 [Marivirga sp. ABR2-2]